MVGHVCAGGSRAEGEAFSTLMANAADSWQVATHSEMSSHVCKGLWELNLGA